MQILDARADENALLPLQQHPAYARALRAARRDVLELRLGADGQFGSALVLRRKIIGLAVSLVSRGPFLCGGVPDADAISALRRRLGGIVLLNAETRPTAGGLVPLMTPAHVAEWHLCADTDVMRAGLHQKWRNRLRRAETAPIAIRTSPFPPDPDHWLLRAEAAQRRVRRYRALPGWLSCAVAATSPGGAQLFEAVHANETIAAMLFLRHGRVATYHIGWSGSQGRALNAHGLLLWSAAQHYVADGIERLDLGTVETDATPGLARFKMGTGAQVRALGGTWLCAPAFKPLRRRVAAPA